MALVEQRRALQRMEELRFGVVAATLANCHRNAEKRPEPYTPSDFFPELRSPEPEPDPLSPDALAAEAERKLRERIANRPSR